jgi:hypothetical protein
MLKDQSTKEKNSETARIRNRKLSRRERAFVANVHVGMGKGEAALAAGYPEASAKVRAVELMDDPSVQLMLQQLAGSSIPEAEAITKEYVLERIRFTGEVALLRGQLASALRAWELLGKTLALFTDRLEVSPVEGLAERLAEARARVGITTHDTAMYRPQLPEGDVVIDAVVETDPQKVELATFPQGHFSP